MTISIKKELDKIIHAVKGLDVRGAIHDGIEKTYRDATKEGNANMEVSRARGRHSTLNSRLSSFETKLKDLSSLTPKQAFETVSDLEEEYPDGADGIYLVREDGYWYIWDDEDEEWVKGESFQPMPLDEFLSSDGDEWEVEK